MPVKEIHIETLTFVFCQKTFHILADNVRFYIYGIPQVFLAYCRSRSSIRDYVNCKCIITLFVDCQAYSVDGNGTFPDNIAHEISRDLDNEPR